VAPILAAAYPDKLVTGTGEMTVIEPR
jgi:hypothetical protein